MNSLFRSERTNSRFGQLLTPNFEPPSSSARSNVKCLDATPFSTIFSTPASLFRCLLLFLGERESLRLFAASCAFLSVVSALAVSHRASTLTLLSRRSKLVGEILRWCQVVSLRVRFQFVSVVLLAVEVYGRQTGRNRGRRLPCCCVRCDTGAGAS